MPAVAYRQSITASIWRAKELGRRIGAQRVVGFARNPGGIVTDLWKNMDEKARKAAFGALLMKSLDQGVATTLVAAFDPKLAVSASLYLEDCQVAAPAANASDEVLARIRGILVQRLLKNTRRHEPGACCIKPENRCIVIEIILRDRTMLMVESLRQEREQCSLHDDSIKASPGHLQSTA